MNEKLYELESVQGTQVLTPGHRYYLAKAVVGASAIIVEHKTEKTAVTSTVREIIAMDDEVVLATRNSIYTFKEAIK